MFSSKNIPFNYVLDEIQSLVLNPFNQFIIISCVSGIFFSQALNESFTRYFVNRKKGGYKVISNDEYLSDFIAKPEIKHKLSFFIDQIRYQEKYKSKGLKTTRGLLLYGPPGTGKTLIARVIVNFLLY